MVKTLIDSGTLIYTDKYKCTEPLSLSSTMHIPSLETTHPWKLPPQHSVLTVELYTTYQTIIFVDQHILPTQILILTDSLNAIHLLSGPRPLGGNHVYTKIMKLLHSVRSPEGIPYTFPWILHMSELLEMKWQTWLQQQYKYWGT